MDQKQPTSKTTAAGAANDIAGTGGAKKGGAGKAGGAGSTPRRSRTADGAADGSAAGATAKRPKASSTAGRTADGKAGPAKARSRTRTPDLKKDLRDFASARPEGWNHDDWLNFLEDLQSRGHNISDREAIGSALEKERLHVALAGLKGIGPQKRQSLAEHYGNLWRLRHADIDEIARVGSLPRKDAERIKSELR